MKITSTHRQDGPYRAVGILFVLFFALAGAQAFAQAPQKATFASPEEAAEALYNQAILKDEKAIARLFGPAMTEWILSGDPVQDSEATKRFAAAYKQKHGFEKKDERTQVLVVGADDFPFPIPIVRHGKRWSFDAEQGKEELLNRRIGRNELHAIQVIQAIGDAQREYASKDRDDSGVLQYAQKIRSTPSKQDGLYWPSDKNKTESPLGPLVSDARREGYTPAAQNTEAVPFHGYFYRILTAQGDKAPGGEMNYIVNGRMIGGFAVIAYPAKYGISGIKTFIMSYAGVVYERDLGPRTQNAVRQIVKFNPDQSWKKL